MNRELLRRAGAEFIGTYGLVTAGCGAIMVNTLTFGLIITVMIAATGHISGAHFNPSVTIACALTRHFAGRDVPVYIGSQLLGATLGASIGAFAYQLVREPTPANE